MTKEEFYDLNQDAIEEAYANHVSFLWLHNCDAGRLSSDEKYFWEWLEETYFKQKDLDPKFEETFKKRFKDILA